MGFFSAGLAITLFVSWAVSRSDHVLLTWGIGVSFLLISLIIYRNFIENLSPLLGTAAFAALITGLTFFLGAARQFKTGVLPLSMMALIASSGSVAMAAPMLSGYNGISYIVLNVVATLILLTTALHYWLWRHEAPALFATMAALYAVVGASFFPCAFILIQNGDWTISQLPTNWAEDLNMVLCLTGIGAMGALSLGLNQMRLTQRHKRDAETDALTGLLNRRALIDRTQRLPAPAAVVVFDIDHFKQVNDVHGHHIGDTVLQMFGAILSTTARQEDMAARLGGEEFAIVLPGATALAAALIAERVRQSFTDHRFVSAAGDFSITVSAGVANATEGQSDFSMLLRQADTALYEAKREGRNRIIFFVEKTNLVPMDEPYPAINFEQARRAVTRSRF